VDFGGIEPAHIAPNSPLHWHDKAKSGEWMVKMKDILVNGEPLHICDERPDGICPAVMDTGSSLITGPTGEVEKLLSKVRTDDTCKSLDQMPEVSLQLVNSDGNTVSYPLTPKEYTLRTLEEVQNTADLNYFKEFPVLGAKNAKAPEVRPLCEPGLGVMDVPGRKWVLGDTFLRRYYSIYDDDKGLIGMVRSIHPDEATPTGPAVEPTNSPPSAALDSVAAMKETKAAMIPLPLAFLAPAKLRGQASQANGIRRAQTGSAALGPPRSRQQRQSQSRILLGKSFL